MDVDNWTFNYFDTRFNTLQKILLEIKTQGDTIMATIADLLTVITGLQTTVNQLGTDLTASIADLQAKITAGTDTAPAIAALQAIATQLTTLDTSSKGL